MKFYKLLLSSPKMFQHPVRSAFDVRKKRKKTSPWILFFAFYFLIHNFTQFFDNFFIDPRLDLAQNRLLINTAKCSRPLTPQNRFTLDLECRESKSRRNFYYIFINFDFLSEKNCKVWWKINSNASGVSVFKFASPSCTLTVPLLLQYPRDAFISFNFV